jgi:HEAT repeat protein
MTDDSPENLRKFLESDDPALVRMGISMAKGSGVPEELLPTILGLYMWDDDKSVRGAAKSVFNKYAPAELQAKVKENWKASYRTLLITGDRFPEAVRPFIQAFKSQDNFAEIALEPLIEALRNGDRKPDRCIRAAEALGKIGEPAMEPLIKALRDRRVVVRRNAAEALGEIGDARAVDPLVKVLGDRNSDVRTTAAKALGKIGDERAVEPLIKALSDDYDDWGVRERAARALGKIGDERAVEPLIRALLPDKRDGANYSSAQHEEDGVRRAAAGALGEIGDERAVEPLITALWDDAWNVISWHAKEALKKLGHEVE